MGDKSLQKLYIRSSETAMNETKLELDDPNELYDLETIHWFMGLLLEKDISDSLKTPSNYATLHPIQSNPAI